MGKRTGAGTAQPPDRRVTFSVALGHRLRRIREDDGESAADIARRSRMYGLNWDRSTVTRLELGQRAVSGAELLLLPHLFRRPLSELLPSEACWLTEAVAASPDALRDAVAGGKPGYGGWTMPLVGATTQGVIKRFQRLTEIPEEVLDPHGTHVRQHWPDATERQVTEGAADVRDETTRKAAGRLNARPEDFGVLARMLWGRSLSAERDARLEERGAASDPRSRQRQRGHITRQLLDEIAPALADLNCRPEGR